MVLKYILSLLLSFLSIFIGGIPFVHTPLRKFKNGDLKEDSHFIVSKDMLVNFLQMLKAVDV